MSKTWQANSRSKPSKPPVPETIKKDVEARANVLIETGLKPKHIKPPAEDNQFNYIVDIYSKWYRGYFYFCAKYCSPGPNAIAPFFEVKFARLEYVGTGHFNLAFMRHTEQWFELYAALSLDECLISIRDDPFFIP